MTDTYSDLYTLISLPSHEGSGLKYHYMPQSLTNMKSPFSRREWIEIMRNGSISMTMTVSLLTKGVD